MLQKIKEHDRKIDKEISFRVEIPLVSSKNQTEV